MHINEVEKLKIDQFKAHEERKKTYFYSPKYHIFLKKGLSFREMRIRLELLKLGVYG